MDKLESFIVGQGCYYNSKLRAYYTDDYTYRLLCEALHSITDRLNAFSDTTGFRLSIEISPIPGIVLSVPASRYMLCGQPLS